MADERSGQNEQPDGASGAQSGDQQQGDRQQGDAGQAGEEQVAREGHSERAGEGGYGNDTGFATGTQGSRDDDGGGSVDGGTSAREQQTSNTYRDTGQGRGAV
jgi:hypothetical protein